MNNIVVKRPTQEECQKACAELDKRGFVQVMEPKQHRKEYHQANSYWMAIYKNAENKQRRTWGMYI
jgi:hypothetical protein